MSPSDPSEVFLERYHYLLMMMCGVSGFSLKYPSIPEVFVPRVHVFPHYDDMLPKVFPMWFSLWNILY